MKIVALALTLSTLAANVYAEQPQATELRNILQSGTYYVEYELNYAKKILAVQDNRRMDYTVYKKDNSFAAMGLSLINPFLAIGSLFMTNEQKTPTTYYEAGKFYQFEGKKKAVMATWDQLNNPNLDPMEGWGSVKYKLALPEELAVLAPEDMFSERLSGSSIPVYVESGKEILDKKEFTYDKYSAGIKSKTGKILFNKDYYFYYDKGELKYIYTRMNDGTGIDIILQKMEIKKITQELPENILKIPKGCKVYAAGIGDMNDLLDKPVLIEEY